MNVCHVCLPPLYPQQSAAAAIAPKSKSSLRPPGGRRRLYFAAVLFFHFRLGPFNSQKEGEKVAKIATRSKLKVCSGNENSEFTFFSMGMPWERVWTDICCKVRERERYLEMLHEWNVKGIDLLSRNSRFLEFSAYNTVMEDSPCRQEIHIGPLHTAMTWLCCCRAAHSPSRKLCSKLLSRPSYCVLEVGDVYSLQFVQWCCLLLGLSFELRIMMREFSFGSKVRRKLEWKWIVPGTYGNENFYAGMGGNRNQKPIPADRPLVKMW